MKKSRAQLRPISFLYSTPDAFEAIFNQRHSSLRLAVDTGLTDQCPPFRHWRRICGASDDPNTRTELAFLCRVFMNMNQETARWATSCGSAEWSACRFRVPPWEPTLSSLLALTRFSSQHLTASDACTWSAVKCQQRGSKMAMSCSSSQITDSWKKRAHAEKEMLLHSTQVLTRMTHTECVTKCASGALSINLCEPAACSSEVSSPYIFLNMIIQEITKP